MTRPVPVRLTLTAKIAGGSLLLVALSVALGTLNLYLNMRRELHGLLGERLVGAVRLAEAGITADDVLSAPPGSAPAGDAAARMRTALAAAQRAYRLDLPLTVLRPTPIEGQLEVVATTADGEPAPGDLLLAGDEFLYAVFSREVMYTRPYDDGGRRRISASAPILTRSGELVAVVKADYDIGAYFAALDARMAWVGLFSCSVALLGGALGVIFARRLTRPIQRLVEAAHRIQAGDYMVHVPVRGHDEIATLSTAFNDMVDGLHERDRVKTAFGMYVAPQVAERLTALSDVLHLEGERREVTVLVSDIRGYTAIAARANPEVLVHALNEYFGVLMDVVFAFEGTIDKFMGDGLLAYFGAPLPHADHRDRAIDAAREMQRRLAALNAEREAAGHAPFHTGIGLAVGDVLLGNIGTDKHLEYTIIGEAVNLAARLCAQAPGDHVFAANAVLQGATRTYTATHLAPVVVKGFPAPVSVSDVAVAGD